jgi:hypothetical protein
MTAADSPSAISVFRFSNQEGLNTVSMSQSPSFTINQNMVFMTGALAPSGWKGPFFLPAKTKSAKELNSPWRFLASV